MTVRTVQYYDTRGVLVPSALSLLLEQQEAALREEIQAQEDRLRKLTELRAALRGAENFSVDSIGDIAYTMNNKNKLRRIHTAALLTGLPLTLLQWTSIFLWIIKGIWQLFALWAVLAIPWGVLISRWYFRKADYLCPECHAVFKPSFREAFLARHTPAARKLTCPHCGRRGAPPRHGANLRGADAPAADSVFCPQRGLRAGVRAALPEIRHPIRHALPRAVPCGQPDGLAAGAVK